jgi:hypothetical protein
VDVFCILHSHANSQLKPNKTNYSPEENAYTLLRLLEEEKTKNTSLNKQLIAVAVICTSVLIIVLGACIFAAVLIAVQATNKDTQSFSLDALMKIMATRFQLVANDNFDSNLTSPANDNFDSNLTSPSSPTPTWPIQIEPIVTLHTGVLSPEACVELIALGEQAGFPDEGESIDDDYNNYSAGQNETYNVSSQSIEVYEKTKGIVSPAIWEALLPWVPRMTELVNGFIDDKTGRNLYYPDEPKRVPSLDWVFFRKYGPETHRNSLMLHMDSNMHTVNIALNDDFTGGGLFYVKPSWYKDLLYPEIPAQYRNYSWVNSLQKENTTDIVFPAMGAGDVLLHNHTVWHAVAPVTAGVRYSFVLFFDTDNPGIQEMQQVLDDKIAASFYHEIEDVSIDLVWVGDAGDDGNEKILVRNMPPFHHVKIETWAGHQYSAKISGTDTIVSLFSMQAGIRKYIIERKLPRDDEL